MDRYVLIEEGRGPKAAEVKNTAGQGVLQIFTGEV